MLPRLSYSHSEDFSNPQPRFFHSIQSRFPSIAIHSGSNRSRRQGSIVILVLVIFAITCLLTYQSLRTVLVIHRGQSQQARIEQARELLDLAKQLERSPAQKDKIKPGQFRIIVQAGNQYGKLELLPSNTLGQGGLEHSGQAIWIAKLPVDSQGNEIPGNSPVVVSLERLSRK